jgi:hypothetical protein
MPTSSPSIEQKLGAPDDFVDDRRHVMLPDAGAEEGQIGLAILVLLQQFQHVPLQRRLAGQRRRQADVAVHAVVGRYLREQAFDIRRADGAQHRRLRLRRGIGHPRMRHC